MFPRLVIDLEKIRRNSEKVAKMLKENGIELVGVTKLFMGEPKLAKVYLETGASIIADSRFQNIRRMKEAGIDGPFMMIRIPPLSHLPEMIGDVDYYLVSEPEVALRIDEMSEKPKKLIYMVDVGDLREGVMYDEAVEEIESVKKKLKRSEIIGVGTNIGCFGGLLPDEENMKRIVDVAKAVDADVISVGGTIYLLALEEGTLPKEVNQFRIGEAILLGTDVTGNRDIPYLEQETVVLEAEIIELKVKPSVPKGRIGYDSMGRKPVFEDRGKRLRAILAVGEQDVNPSGLKPLDEGAIVIHASSDHMIVDVTDVQRPLKVGDILRFRANYSATLRAVTSPHVEKVWL